MIYDLTAQLSSFPDRLRLIIKQGEADCESMASCFLIVFLGILWCSNASASFTTAATRFAKATGGANTLLGTYSRSRTVASLSLLEQEKLEEAKESLAQSALTLALLDVGGGAVLPVAEEITEYVKTRPEFAGTRQAWTNYNNALNDEAAKVASESVDSSAIQRAKQALKNALKVDAEKFPRLSKVGKAFTKASKWLKGASIFDVLGPLTDTLSIGLNIWGLEMAIRDNNPAGIAAASLSIAAGVVGLTTFFAAIITGSAVLGPIGAIAGALLGIAATLIELFAGPSYDRQAVEEFRARLQELRNLRDACGAQIVARMDFLEKVGSSYTDVYANNQAASLRAADHGAMDMFDCNYREGSRRDHRCPQFKNSMHLRRFVGSNINDLNEAKEELSNGTYVCMGNFRGILSPIMPIESSSTGLGKTKCSIGFDFYGKFKEGTSYGGVHVFVNSEFVSEEELNDFNINTDIPAETEQNDVISIGEYRKFYKRGKITIDTGGGSDCLNINGMIGEFSSDYANLFKAKMGSGFNNVLSFQGISKDRDDIKGVFFDSKTGVLKYYHGAQRNTHKIGTVNNVNLFSGTPFDDYLILYTRHYRIEFKAIQTSGRNVYEFNYDDLNVNIARARRFHIIDKSTHAPKINLKTADASTIDPKKIVLGYKKMTVYSSDRNEWPVIEVTLDIATKANLFINDANPRPIDFAHISTFGKNSEVKNFTFPVIPRNVDFNDGDELLLLKWKTDQAQNSVDHVVDMKGGDNRVIISDKFFLEPSGVDGETVTLTLKQGSVTGAYIIATEKPGDPSFSFNIELRNVERIINEYGDQVMYLIGDSAWSPPVPLDLYDRYMEITRMTLGVKTTENILEQK